MRFPDVLTALLVLVLFSLAAQNQICTMLQVHSQASRRMEEAQTAWNAGILAMAEGETSENN